MLTEESSPQKYRRRMSWQVRGVYLSIRLGVRLIQRRLRLTRYYLRTGRYHLVLPPHVNQGSTLQIYKHHQTDLTCLMMQSLNALSRWSSRFVIFWKERIIMKKFNMLYTRCVCMGRDARREFPLSIKTSLSTVRLRFQTKWYKSNRPLNKN